MLKLQPSWRRVQSVFAAFLLLIGSLTASWHQTSLADPLSIDLWQLPLPPGAHLEELEASICHHSDGTLPGIPARDEKQPCKTCPLCAAFQHAPFLPNPAFDDPACGWAVDIAFLPDPSKVLTAPEFPEEGRPRAPPLA